MKINNSKEYIPYFILLFTAFILLHSIFSPGLMTYSDNIPHFIELYYLKTLIANGNISGWYPYVFAGIPLYTYIPILGHYLIVLLSLIINIELAYKIILFLSFIGPSLLMFRFLKFRFKILPSLLVSISLLFIESWHGAILTGLWATGIALCLLILLIDFSFKLKQNLKNSLILAIILFLIILAHNIIGIIAIMFLFCKTLADYKNYKRNIYYLLIVLVIGILLSSFYIFPIIQTSNYTNTPIGTRIGLGNSLKEIIFIETGMLFSLKIHLEPIIKILNINLKEGFLELFYSIFKNLSVLLLDLLAFLGIFYIFKNKLLKNIEIRTMFIFFLILVLYASNFWLLIPFFTDITILNTIAVYPARAVYTAKILLPFFAVIGLSFLIKKYKKVLYLTLLGMLIIPLMFITINIPNKSLTQTSSSSITFNEAIETILWINNTVDPYKTRVFDQNTYGNSNIERKNMILSISPIYTKVNFLTSWITRVYHTEEFLITETGVIGKNKIENVSINEFKNILITYNSKYVITSDKILKNKLLSSKDFILEKEGKTFSVFNFKDYNPLWISYEKPLDYNISFINNDKIEFLINSSNKQNIELKFSYHPYWKINNNIKIYETSNKLIGLEIPKGRTNFTLEFIAIPKIFEIISLVTLCIVIIAIIIL